MKLENIGTFSLQKNSVKRELFSPYSRAKGFRDKFLIYSVTSISFCFLFTTHSYYFVSAEQIVRLVSEQVDRLQWTFRHDPPQASHSLATDSRSCSKSGRFVFISEVTGHVLGGMGQRLCGNSALNVLFQLLRRFLLTIKTKLHSDLVTGPRLGLITSAFYRTRYRAIFGPK